MSRKLGLHLKPKMVLIVPNCRVLFEDSSNALLVSTVLPCLLLSVGLWVVIRYVFSSEPCCEAVRTGAPTSTSIS